MICTFTGMGLFFGSVFIVITFIKNINFVILIEIFVLLIINLILWFTLLKNGTSEFRKLSY